MATTAATTTTATTTTTTTATTITNKLGLLTAFTTATFRLIYL